MTNESSHHCPVCSSRNAVTLWRWQTEPFLKKIGCEKTQYVVQCESCGIIFRSPALERELIDALHEGLDLEMHSEIDYKDRISWLGQRIPCDQIQGPVLEVGSATGTFLRLLNEAGIHVEGIDPNQEAVEKAREVGFTVHQGYVENVNLPDDYYAGVVLMHLLEHVDAPKEFLKSLRQVMKPDGFLYVEVPNLYEVPRPFGAFLPSFHRTEFVPDTLRYLLESSGFTIEDMESAYSIRAIAKVQNDQQPSLDIQKVIAQTQNQFRFNTSAKQLGETLGKLTQTQGKNLEDCVELLKQSPYREHFLWRHKVMTTNEKRWLAMKEHKGIASTVIGIVASLRRDPQMAYLIKMAGHPGIQIAGHMGRVEFPTLNVRSLDRESMQKNNSEQTLQDWLQQFLNLHHQILTILDHIARVIPKSQFDQTIKG